MKILPKPTVKAPLAGKSDAWTESEVRGLFCNPLYIGHPFSEEEWIRQAARMIKEEGREQFLVNMLAVMRATGVLVEPPVVRQGEGLTPYGFSENQTESFPGFGGTQRN